MTELFSLIETISSCESLDDLQALLVELDSQWKRGKLTAVDERLLRKHLQVTASRLLRDERMKLAAERIGRCHH